MKKILSVICYCYIFIYCLNVSADSNVFITDAWINEAPPNVPVLAAYLTIKNTGQQNVKLINVKSMNFDRIELHLTLMENGIAKMQKQDSLVIPANSEINLAPGSYHLMLFDSKKTLVAGDQVPIELIMSNGDTLSINAEVRRLDMNHQHNHH